MSDIRISDMMKMQMALWEKHCRNMGRDYDSQYREMYSK